jgi:tetratricopeptide (TPR) repeat protein
MHRFDSGKGPRNTQKRPDFVAIIFSAGTGLDRPYWLFLPYWSFRANRVLNGLLTGALKMTLTKAFRTAGLFAAMALLVTGISLKPVLAVGTDSPSAPTDDGGKKKKKKKTDNNVIEQQEQKLAQEKFLRDYRAARELILAGNYKEGIAAMHALGHDEHPDVANYIGYSYRRAGDYENSKVWYEKALASDPNHVRTWSYYGMWQMEQGNRLKALDDLQKVKLICGNTSCEEYRQLKAVIDGTETY